MYFVKRSLIIQNTRVIFDYAKMLKFREGEDKTINLHFPMKIMANMLKYECLVYKYDSINGHLFNNKKGT